MHVDRQNMFYIELERERYKSCGSCSVFVTKDEGLKKAQEYISRFLVYYS